MDSKRGAPGCALSDNPSLCAALSGKAKELPELMPGRPNGGDDLAARLVLLLLPPPPASPRGNLGGSAPERGRCPSGCLLLLNEGRAVPSSGE